jgi:S-adenosylmethionine decarboxylase
MSSKLLPIPPRQPVVGRHVLVDAWGSPPDLLNNPETVREALVAAIEAGGVTLIESCVHQFSPYGVTATATLAESHMAIHTWPEYGYFAADLFFCGSGDTGRAVESLRTSLKPRQFTVRELERGVDVVESQQDEPEAGDITA